VGCLVQAKLVVGGAPATNDPAAIHQAAARGTRTGKGPLPFRDRIQKAFGSALDVDPIQAYTGEEAAKAAAEMGAEAVASAHRVAFANKPDLWLTAHEAAHVAQQRSGRALLPGGVGREGDPYEKHADRVADLVVSGQSVEHLFPEHRADPSSSPSHARP